MSKKIKFKIKDYIIYPSHGIGRITEVKNMKIGTKTLKTLVIKFTEDNLTINIPYSQINKINIRHLVKESKFVEIFQILQSGIKKQKGMWSRRAKEYEEKINSGDVIMLAEVLRDLTRDVNNADRSYSERVIYETALYRLAKEYSIIKNLDIEEAKEEIIITAKNKMMMINDGYEIEEINDDDDNDDFDEEFDEKL